MRKKLRRFTDNAQRANVVEPPKPLYENIKGKWHTNYFYNNHPIFLELGCGYGEYTVQLAQKFAHKNFIGIDLKGARLWVGSTQAINSGLNNVAFLRAPISSLTSFFLPGEIDEMILPFPDPRPKKSEASKRLTSPAFLAIYRSLLAPGGWIHLKTDNDLLYNYTRFVLQQNPFIKEVIFTDDLYQSDWRMIHEGIVTRYETRYLQEKKTIKYIRFNFHVN